MLVQRTLGEIERGEQLAAPLGIANGFGPFRGRTLGHCAPTVLAPDGLCKGVSYAWARRSSTR